MHRVVGPPGIVLVGEGNPNRVQALLATERRKHERVAAETPIHEVIVRQRRGRGAAAEAGHATSASSAATGQAGRDDRHAQPAQGARRQPRPPLPMPKGPVPTSMKGIRGQTCAAADPSRQTRRFSYAYAAAAVREPTSSLVKMLDR